MAEITSNTASLDEQLNQLFKTPFTFLYTNNALIDEGETTKVNPEKLAFFKTTLIEGSKRLNPMNVEAGVITLELTNYLHEPNNDTLKTMLPLALISASSDNECFDMNLAYYALYVAGLLGNEVLKTTLTANNCEALKSGLKARFNHNDPVEAQKLAKLFIANALFIEDHGTASLIATDLINEISLDDRTKMFGTHFMTEILQIVESEKNTIISNAEKSIDDTMTNFSAISPFNTPNSSPLRSTEASPITPTITIRRRMEARQYSNSPSSAAAALLAATGSPLTHAAAAAAATDYTSLPTNTDLLAKQTSHTNEFNQQGRYY